MLKVGRGCEAEGSPAEEDSLLGLEAALRGPGKPDELQARRGKDTVQVPGVQLLIMNVGWLQRTCVGGAREVMGCGSPSQHHLTRIVRV